MKSYINFLRNHKGYTFIDVIGLAVSMMFVVLIGAYTWNETHLDRQHSKLDRLYLLCTESDGELSATSHWRMIRKLMDNFPEIESGTALSPNDRQLLMPDGKHIKVNMLYVDSTFYDLLDFKLVRGDEHTALKSPQSIVITEELGRRIWKDEDPIGKTLIDDEDENRTFVVSAIMERMENTVIGTDDPSNPIEAVVRFENYERIHPNRFGEEMYEPYGSGILLLAKEGVDLSANAQKYTEFVKQSCWVFNLPDKEVSLRVIPLSDIYFAGVAERYWSMPIASGNPTMVKLLFTVGLVIFIFALMNYINLTVAIAGYRAKEMATRRLLGSTRADIIMKLIGESTLLCFVAFAIGAFLAWLALPYAEQLVSAKIPLAHCVTPVTVSIVIGIILLTGFLAGIIPAMLISSSKPIDVVRGTFRRHTKMIFSKIFIVIQNVVTITMIACVITMNMQIHHIVYAPLGYEIDDIMFVPKDGEIEKTMAFKQRVEQLPGVEAVSVMSFPPVIGYNSNMEKLENGKDFTYVLLWGDENYLDILGLELDRNNQPGSEREKIYVNHQFLNELGLPEDAESFSLPWFGTHQISGILKDFVSRTVLDEPRPLILKIKHLDTDFFPWGTAVKVNGDQLQVFEKVKEIYEEIYNENLDVSRPYLRQMVDDKFEFQHSLIRIIEIFTAMAIMISLLGLVAISSYMVQQRRQEIAVKKVFGCQSRALVGKLVMSFLAYVVVAFVISIPIIYKLMNNWLAEYSYRIDVYWWIYAIAGIVCLAVSALAVLIQSYRAANENPVSALYQNQ